MAKKRVVRKKKANTKKEWLKGFKGIQRFLKTLRRIIIAALIILVILLGLLYIYEERNSAPQSNKITAVKQQAKQIEKAIAKSVKAIKGSDTDLAKNPTQIPLGAELPQLQSNEKEQIIAYEGYTVSFNSTYKLANWVAYELTIDESTSKKHKRSNKFLIDKRIKGGTADNRDYTRTGFDRGHLAPAGDMTWSHKAMQESFYMSNIAPQSPQLNRGLWKELEELVCEWAISDSSILIATGPILNPSLKRLGKNRVAIPNEFYKVIVSLHGKQPKGVAFVFNNRGYKNTSLKELAMPIDDVEKKTQIDFFASLPDELEQMVEKRVALDKWTFNSNE